MTPTEVEAFVLVLGVEEDPLGVGVDVGASCDEQRGDVALSPLDSDVQCRLPCGQGGVSAGAAWGLGDSTAGTLGDRPYLAFSPFWPPYPPRNPSEITAACRVCVASYQESQLPSLLHSFLHGSKEYLWSVRSAPKGGGIHCTQDAVLTCPEEAHSLTEN